MTDFNDDNRRRNLDPWGRDDELFDDLFEDGSAPATAAILGVVVAAALVVFCIVNSWDALTKFIGF